MFEIRLGTGELGSTLKIFRCPKCNTEHTYYTMSQVYCEKQACGSILPDVDAILASAELRILWHFGRYRTH